MFFSKALIIAFAASVLALPAPAADSCAKAADTTKAAAAAATTAAKATAAKAASGSGGGVLTVSNYADFQVSDGVAGNALDEVKAKFPINFDDLANVDSNDLAIIKAARVTAEAAETDTGGFNDAIAAASGAAADALQVGKIKNKVLKLELEVLSLQIDQAQTGKDNSAKIDEETTKLNNNIKTDKASAGDASQSVDFQGDDSP